MKIIFLNTWNGKVREKIIEFIRQESVDTDIFCFQEVYDDMQEICKDILSGYREVSGYKFVTNDDDFPQSTYVKNNIPILDSGVLFQNELDRGFGIWVRVQLGKSDLYICNYHGMSRPGDKLDNPDRLNASQKIIDFFKNKEGYKIIGGDFNILISAKSIEMFQENGYKNLVKDYNIFTTRNRYVWELYPDNKLYHSDYVFVSPEMHIQEFTVPHNEISDHLPLILSITAE